MTLYKERVSYTTAQKLKIIKYIEMNGNRAECLKAIMFADLSQNNSKKNYLIEELLSNSLIVVTLWRNVCMSYIVIKEYKWSTYFLKCLCKAITFNYITGLKVNKLIQIMIIANLLALENPCKVQHETLRQVHASDRKLLNIYHAWSQQVIKVT